MQEATPPQSDSENPYRSPAAPPEAALTRFSIADLLILTAVIAATCAAWAYYPGLGLIATVLLAPVAVRSLLVFKRRAALGIETSPTKKAAMIVASVFVAAMIYLGVLVAVCVAFCFGCFALLATGPDSTGVIPWVVLFGAPLAALIASVWVAGRWVRRRWRRDTDTGEETYL